MYMMIVVLIPRVEGRLRAQASLCRGRYTAQGRDREQEDGIDEMADRLLYNPWNRRKKS